MIDSTCHFMVQVSPIFKRVTLLDKVASRCLQTMFLFLFVNRNKSFINFYIFLLFFVTWVQESACKSSCVLFFTRVTVLNRRFNSNAHEVLIFLFVVCLRFSEGKLSFCSGSHGGSQTWECKMSNGRQNKFWGRLKRETPKINTIPVIWPE